MVNRKQPDRPRRLSTIKKRQSQGYKSRPKVIATPRKPRQRLIFAKYAIWFAFAIAAIFLYLIHDLPSLNSLAAVKRQPAITIRASDKTKIITFGDYYAKPVSLDKLKRATIDMFIATEDRRFYQHYGIDLVGLCRAIFHNIQRKTIAQGGSTITQQVAKDFLVSQKLYKFSERSFKRKAQEIILSIWLEITFTKSQILTLYLNRAYFGSGAFGIAAASRHYFNKSATALTVYESALLAGLLKAPTAFSPVAYSERSQTRTRQVVLNYRAAGYGDDTVVERYHYPDLKVAHNGQPFARYFCDYILSELDKLGGPLDQDVIVHSTLSYSRQKIMENKILEYITKSRETLAVAQGAGIQLDHKGRIIAMVGGINYYQSPFNRAYQACRQTGSLFKLFVFLSAFEKGWQPGSIVSDTQVRFKKWQPKNFGWVSQGNITVKDAFAFSVNTAAVRIANKIGAQAIQKMAQRCGIDTLQPSDLTVALGAGGGTLLQMTAAYATVARRGSYIKPYGINKVVTTSGQVLYSHRDQPAQIIQPIYANMMDQLLLAVMRYGTGRHYPLSIPCAGKTGTTQNYRDAWFIGYDARSITGIWVGNDLNQPMNKVTGAGLPCQIWQAIMDRKKNP